MIAEFAAGGQTDWLTGGGEARWTHCHCKLTPDRRRKEKRSLTAHPPRGWSCLYYPLCTLSLMEWVGSCALPHGDIVLTLPQTGRSVKVRVCKMAHTMSAPSGIPSISRSQNFLGKIIPEIDNTPFLYTGHVFVDKSPGYRQ